MLYFFTPSIPRFNISWGHIFKPINLLFVMTIETTLIILTIILLQGSSLPQFIKNYKTKSTKDISFVFPLMIVLGNIFALIVAILTKNIYFQILYGLGIVNFSLLIIQILYYRRKKSTLQKVYPLGYILLHRAI